MFMDSETESKYAQNGKVVLASTTVLFLLLLIVIFLHTFRHSCFRRGRHNHHRHHRRLPTNSAVALNKGLHPSLISSLPTFAHSSTSAAVGHSCAVCMSEFAAGDEGRVLPICRHAFHSHCIDVWFRSHSNCPLCRTPVQSGPTRVGDAEPGPVSWSSFPEPVWCPRKPLELEEERLRKISCVINNLTTHM